jgi:hypothetical protein
MPSPKNLDARIDRLVDGELTPAEYQCLLADLDEQPDGWRRCAMAFLEAQAWRRELGAIVAPSRSPRVAIVPEPAQTEVAPVPRTASRSQRRILSVAIAAGFLLAFALGALVRWPSTQDPGPSVVSVPSPETMADVVTPEAAEGRTEGSPPAPPQADESNVEGPWGSATFVMHGGDGPQAEVDVPVYPLDEAHARYALNATAVLPAEARNELLECGFDLRQTGVRWLPMVADNGCQVLVPYNEVEITQLTQNAFQ